MDHLCKSPFVCLDGNIPIETINFICNLCSEARVPGTLSLTKTTLEQYNFIVVYQRVLILISVGCVQYCFLLVQFHCILEGKERVGYTIFFHFPSFQYCVDLLERNRVSLRSFLPVYVGCISEIV